MGEKHQVIEQLMQEYGHGLWCYVYSQVKHVPTADDLTQDVFLRAYEHLEQFQNQSSIKTWLYSIAKNRCRDYFKSAFFRKVLFVEKLTSNAHGDVEEEAMQSLENAMIWEAVFQLNRSLREVVVLHLKEDMSFRDIANVLGILEGTARVRYHRALKLLKESLGKEMDVHAI